MPRTPTATTTYYHVGKIPSLEIKNCTNPAPAACGQPKTPAKHPVYGRTLASIRERHVGKTAREHDRFWADVDARLDELGLDAETHASIGASISARVPRVTAENAAVFNAETERVASEIAADLASIGIRPPGGV